jgi:hypothetical protein
MAAPWAKIRTEWLKGRTTYAKLAKKYGLKEQTIKNRAYKEGWGKEKVQIEDEARTKTRARIVRVREEQLEKLATANSDMIEVLLAIVAEAKAKPTVLMFDAGGTLRNTESLTKAIQLAVQNQREIYRLPDIDQELKKKEVAQKKKEAKEKLALEREKWEAEKAEKAKAQSVQSGTVWQIEEPDGEETDG